ncbi:MAG: T9SS C-terminal target domain-containing protein [Bacteroidetes bacterium]|nr:T9SS C-terminal target domain-containing protein [Bacteroidota bacterium]
MRILYSILVLSVAALNVQAQSGCTDPQATNYDAAAVTNDGSCLYPASTEATTNIGNLLPEAPESSGIVLTEGYIFTHNDHGGHPEIYKVDKNNGSLVQTIAVSNFPNNDWEDITADSGYIYVGDFGNNDGDRTDLKILKISKAQFLSNTSPNVSVTAEAINFSYSDQTVFTPSSTHNFDCEAVMSIKDSLYIFTKDRGDMQTRVYKLPKTPGTYIVSPYTSYDVKGLITGADYNSKTHEVVLIGYLSSHKNSFIYYLDDFKGDMFFSGNKRRIEIGNATNDWQTEGITYDTASQLLLSCESSYVPASLFVTDKRSIFPLAIADVPAKTNNIKIFPNPSKGQFSISSDAIIESIEVTGMDGKMLLKKNISNRSCNISRAELGDITEQVIIKVNTDGDVSYHKLLLLPLGK